MTKEEIKENFDALAVKAHNNIASEVRGILYNLKSTWNWNNADLAFFLDTTESRIEDILSEYWDGRMSAKTFARINLLTMGKFGMPGCNFNKETETEMSCIIGAFQETKIPPRTREEKVQDILGLFGVTDDSSLDRLLNAIVDVRKAIDRANLDEVENDKCKCNKHNATLTGTCYDSKTMDKPKSFAFDLDNLNSDDIKKMVSRFNTIASNFLNKNK